MNALEQEIRALIESEGPISVSRYMALALGHPLHGYYIKRDPLGAAGDFVTAPEISQMFGEMLGVWCAEVWRSMGEPEAVNLVEFGPGRGALMSDLLRAGRVLPAFRAAVRVHLVETSPTLTERQRAALAGSGAEVEWHRSFSNVPDGPLIAIGNEFVDALPVDQFVKTESGWHERKVGMKDGRLVFALDPAPLSGIEEQLPARLRPAHTGALLERTLLAPVRDAVHRIATQGGAALFIDYGHTETGFGDTLQAVRAHKVANVLEDPGEADLTAHVDFEMLSRVATLGGLHAVGPVTQGNFLRAIGIELRAERLKRGQSDAVVKEVDAALARLTGPSPGMGELFKAVACVHPSLPTPPGFDS
jgi:NADH dehydrogenase [ubiquinone] 1 alpha subcomplex assembly factor 7